MNRWMRQALVALCGAGLVAGAGATGRAEVRYAAPEHFTDAGFGPLELARTQRVLTDHITRLAKRLPDGQVLSVEVRDIDLAGELESLPYDRIRVLGRVPDRPRLELSFELRAGAEVLDSGQAVLTDLAYLDRTVGQRQSDALPYERRLLDRWFAERIVPAGAR